MSDRKLRSSSKRKAGDENNQYICSCKGKNNDITTISCTFCGYLCCKDCIWKRFDISSERKYKNIIKHFLCSNCTHNHSQPPLKKRKITSNTNTNNNGKEEFDEDEFERARLDFCDKMKVYVYSIYKLNKIKDKYSEEIKQREIAISKISAATNEIDEENKNINSVPSDILKIIFIFSVGDGNKNDKTVLTLIKVCKYWRDIIHSNKNDTKFHEYLWFGSINNLGSYQHVFEWKHLVLIPDEYLKLILNMLNIQNMTKNEMIEYRQLIDDEYDANNDYMIQCSLSDTNIPLLIQILIKCPKIHSISLTGLLCQDIFFAIGENCKYLRCLSLSFTENGENEWLNWLIGDDDTVKDTLWNIDIQRSYWCNDETLYYLSFCKNLANISSEKYHVSGDGLLYLFQRCTNLLSLHLDRYIDGAGEWEKAFKCLAEKNKDIQCIDFNGCEGFNDQCLSYLMNPESCPKLQELTINYHSCSTEMIKKFKKERPNVSICGEAVYF